MTIEDYKKVYEEFTSLTSQFVRQLSFAGIAIIWLFKFDQPTEHLIPQELFLPLLFFILSLSAEFLQYLVSSIVWFSFFKQKEKEYKGKNSKEVKAEKWRAIPGWFFFSLKIIFVLIAYFFII